MKFHCYLQSGRNFLFGVPHSRILSAFSQQFIVSTGFSNLSVRYHKDLICIFDNGKGMSNHYHSLFLFQQIGDGLLYGKLVLDIKGRCCFIQKQDRAVFQDSAGDGNPPTLTAREKVSVLAGRRIVSLFHLANETVTISLPASSLDFLVRGIGAGVPDIVPDGIVKEK